MHWRRKGRTLSLPDTTIAAVKIVDRWEQLERLPFDDPQLEEASKAFLYGFYRASVVLCASAVETELKQLASPRTALDTTMRRNGLWSLGC